MEGLVRYFFYIEIPINAESHMYKVTTMYSQLSNKQVCWNKRVGLNFSSNLINEYAKFVAACLLNALK